MKKRQLTIGQKMYTNLLIEVKGVNTEEGSLQAIFSTADVDRHGDVVKQDGWDLRNFIANPVILNSHNYDDATEVIGRSEDTRVENGQLQGKIIFAVKENPKAKVIFDLYAGKFLNAFSVGFIVQEFASNADGTRDWFTIEKAELLEVSAVSVPANARALAKAKGIDVDILPNQKDYEQNNNETNGEVPKNNETTENSEQEPTGNGDGSNGKPKESTEDGSGTGGNGNGDDNTPTGTGPTEAGGEVTEPEKPEPEKPEEEKIEPEPVQASYQHRVLHAITNMTERKNEKLKRAQKIIESIVYPEKHEHENTKKENRKQKINKAIRILLESK